MDDFTPIEEAMSAIKEEMIKELADSISNHSSYSEGNIEHSDQLY